jgi:hypothetical protein
MATLQQLTDRLGRIRYNHLTGFIASHTLNEFIRQAEHPFLIGKELYDLEIAGNTSVTEQITTSTNLDTGTILFDPNEFPEGKAVRSFSKPVEIDSSKDEHSIYLLHKYSDRETQLRLEINIGRSRSNDIIIGDSTVSGHHAKITVVNGMYFITDLNSTNKTKLNSFPIKPETAYQLSSNMNLSFGKLCFVFAHPLQVYRGIKKEIL